MVICKLDRLTHVSLMNGYRIWGQNNDRCLTLRVKLWVLNKQSARADPDLDNDLELHHKSKYMLVNAEVSPPFPWQSMLHPADGWCVQGPKM